MVFTEQQQVWKVNWGKKSAVLNWPERIKICNTLVHLELQRSPLKHNSFFTCLTRDDRQGELFSNHSLPQMSIWLILLKKKNPRQPFKWIEFIQVQETMEEKKKKNYGKFVHRAERSPPGLRHRCPTHQTLHSSCNSWARSPFTFDTTRLKQRRKWSHG